MIRVMRYGEIPEEEIFFRGEIKSDVGPVVADIIAKVRARGDEALREFADRFDGGAPESLEVTPEEMAAAVRQTDPALLAVMKESVQNIRDYHSRQVRSSFVISEKDGVVLGQKITPIGKVGIYVPGGTAPLSSSVLMNAVPAKLAGCREIVMATPARAGFVDPAMLAAASVAGVDRVFRIGGAQAIAALAYGTQTVPQVDKIVGPGNAFVAEAKRQVYGQVSIDMIAGPSEILIVADGKTDPRHAAADLLSQAEHDKVASAVLVTDSASLAGQVAAEVEKQLETLPRREIARAAIDQFGKIIVCDSIRQAVEISNRIAPEHLELCVDQPFDLLSLVQNAGSVFLGRSCPEALGDYFSGPNHILPTMGTARFSSPLSVDDFVKKTQFSYYSPKALNRAAEKVAVFARAESLEGHARSALSRMNGKEENA